MVGDNIVWFRLQDITLVSRVMGQMSICIVR